ncbi:MAG: flippase-like domain-containing protein [Clostridiales bacterium]|nr:flippase-like domain-containing protein [Clostridiales bacterium]
MEIRLRGWTDRAKQDKIGGYTDRKERGESMSKSMKKALSALFILLSVAAVFCIAFGNAELADAWDALRRLNPAWLAGLFCCWAAFVFFDVLATWQCLRRQGFSVSLPRVMVINIIGLYYSNITPGASGGQPMQVNYMRKAGIPVGNGTTAVTIRLIANQFMVSLLSLLFLVFNRAFVYEQLAGGIWFVRIGWLINFAVVPLVLLAAFKPKWVRKLAAGFIGLLARIRLVKDRDGFETRVNGMLDTYYTAIHDLLRSPAQILLQCLFSALSMLALTGSVVFVYFAFGLSGTPWYQVLALSLLLFVSASYTPLPGASGAQEGGFLYYFRNVFTGGTVGLALLAWRFFTYYIALFVGVITLLLEGVTRRKSAHSASTEKDQPDGLTSSDNNP